MTNLVKIHGRKSLFKPVAHVIEKSRKQTHQDERRVSVGDIPALSPFAFDPFQIGKTGAIDPLVDHARQNKWGVFPVKLWWWQSKGKLTLVNRAMAFELSISCEFLYFHSHHFDVFIWAMAQRWHIVYYESINGQCPMREFIDTR